MSVPESRSRKCRAVCGRRHRSVAFVLAAAVAVTPAISLAQTNPALTAPATTRPASSADARVHDALERYGTVDALAADLYAGGAAHSESNEFAARVLLEQGELAPALSALRAEAAASTPDVALLRRVASVEEKLGQVGPAQEALRSALDRTSDPAVGLDVCLRLALLAFDDGRATEGVGQLDRAVQAHPAAAAQAGVIAYVVGQYDAAARLLARAPGEIDPGLRLLQGNAALRAGRVAAATTAFDAALSRVTEAHDRRYAQERLIAAARQAGTLPALADAWLARPDLSPDQLLPLATVLRELGRVPELLARWKQDAADPKRSATVLSPRFINEVTGASQEAGLVDQADAVARQLLSLSPDDDQALAAVVRLLLSHGKAADADALFRSRIGAAADRPDALQRLARSARSLGRDAAAIEAARALRTFGGDYAVSGSLLEASVRLRAGDTEAGFALLKDAARNAQGYPDRLREVATAFESAGRDDDAIELLGASARLSPGDTTLERLASLLIQHRRFPEAMPLLQTLRTQGSTPAVRTQAGLRLLDIAVEQHSVDRLVADMRRSFDAGTATEADLNLLTDAYARSNNVDAAADLLKGNRLLDRKTTLAKLAVLYLRAPRLPEASDALRELVEADPDGAVATLERLASVELDRRRPQAAAAVIDEIAKRIGSRSASFAELMGGIYDRLGRPAQAAPYYRRALVRHPENADTWLLWATAMSKSDQSRQAVGRLGILCDEAPNDSVFAIAVDGLLNLKASPAQLRAARREAILRVASDPGSRMLLQVIADLSDELRDNDAVARALDAGAALDRESRPQLLRELMDAASEKGLLDEANACGRTMLALGDDFPPQSLIQLGDRLLVAGRVSDASRAFTRAMEVASDEQVAPRAAELFEQYGVPAAAVDILAPLAERKRTDLPLRQTFARLSELAGRMPAAFDAYMSAIALAERELAELPPGPPPRGANPPPRPELSVLVNGAIATARTPDQQRRLLEDLSTRILGRLDATPADADPPDVFFQLLDQSRRAGIALGRLDAVDRLDATLRQKRPGLDRVARGGLAVRLDFGLFDAAANFARANGLGPAVPAPLRLPAAWATPTTAPAATTLPAVLDVSDTALLLPRLITKGQIEAARELLRGVPKVMPPRPLDSLPALIAAAAALGDDAAATEWTTLWAAHVVSPPDASGRPAANTAGLAVQGMFDLVQSVWEFLPPAARAEVARQALSLSDRTAGTNAAAGAATLAVRLWANSELPHRVDIAVRMSPMTRADPKRGANPSTGRIADLAARLNLLPAGDRAAFVGRALDQLPPECGLAFLQRLVDQSDEPFDPAVEAAIVAAADALPDGQLVVWSNWFISPARRHVLPALAASALRRSASSASSGDTLALNVAAAVALSNDDPIRAGRLAGDAVTALLDYGLVADADAGPVKPAPATSPAATTSPATTSPAPATRPAATSGPAARTGLPAGVSWVTLARYALAVMPAEARTQLLGTLASQDGAADTSPVRRARGWLVRSALLDAAGGREAATDALRQAFALGGDDPGIRDAFVNRLVQDGRPAELVDAFAAAGPAALTAVRAPLTDALWSLFRGREVPLPDKTVGAGAVTPRRVLDFVAPRANNDYVKLAQTLRTYLERLRSNEDGPSPLIEADPAGLPVPAGGPGVSPRLFHDLGQWPGAVDDLLATLRTLPQGRSAADGVIGILQSAATDPAVVTHVTDTLLASSRAGTLTTNDRMLIERLAATPGVHLPLALTGEIWNDFFFDPGADPDYRLLAAGLRAQGDPHAADFENWAAIRSKGTNPVRSYLARTAAAGLPSWSPPGNEDRTLAAAGQGHVEAFEAKVAVAIESAAWSQLRRPTRLDICRVLPATIADRGLRDTCGRVVERALIAAATRWPADTNWTRSTASLGRWYLQNGDRAAADRMFERAAELASKQGNGEHWLWAADLAVLLNRPDRAWEIERQLLQDRCLPATRIPALLSHLDAAGDVKTASRLAASAGLYAAAPGLTDRLKAPPASNP